MFYGYVNQTYMYFLKLRITKLQFFNRFKSIKFDHGVDFICYLYENKLSVQCFSISDTQEEDFMLST